MITADEARKKYYGSLVYCNTVDYIKYRILGFKRGGYAK